jgi:putative PIN family toxin of toxin-antitoxin system
MRVVLDTNLIVRAAGGRAGLGRELMLLAVREPHRLLLSHSLYAEVRKVMHYQHLRVLHGLGDAEIQSFLDYLVAGAEQVNVVAAHVGPLVGLDPTDDTVLLAAVSGSADAIGTNNRHFFAPDVLHYAQCHGIRVLRDVDLIAELRQ